MHANSDDILWENPQRWTVNINQLYRPRRLCDLYVMDLIACIAKLIRF